MPQGEPEVGAVGVAETVVRESDLASALPLSEQDAYPPVWATARMIALMEIASARILAPCLVQGELSVGVNVDAIHSAATPVGQKVRATARYLGREGKLYRFEVTAEDGGGQVGKATHTRAIITTDRLLTVAARRCKEKL